MHIPRVLEIAQLLESTTVFLLGPRQTGKSWFIRNQLNTIVKKTYNLLDQGLLRRFLANPSLLREELAANNFQDTVVCIDEIQKCPQLLDEIHLLIEEHSIRFLLTGSSARSLKKHGVNLLGGRGRDRMLKPLSFIEVRDTFTLEKAFRSGMLPSHYLNSDPEDALDSYVGRYLSEEIASEGLTRNLPAFSRFLQVAACCNAQEINYTAVASDCGLARQTVQSWFTVLQDTMIGNELFPFTKTLKRKAIERAKFYFFDIGIVRALRGFPVVSQGSADFGSFFEHFIYMELAAWRAYKSPRTELTYWRSTSGYEVDFLIDQEFALEVKASQHIDDRDLRGLRALREEGLVKNFVVICREPSARQTSDGIQILPWQIFLERLWAGS